MTVDLHPIRAFLDETHGALLAKAQAFGRDVLDRRGNRPIPMSRLGPRPGPCSS
jgi:hypothetical protein